MRWKIEGKIRPGRSEALTLFISQACRDISQIGGRCNRIGNASERREIYKQRLEGDQFTPRRMKQFTGCAIFGLFAQQLQKSGGPSNRSTQVVKYTAHQGLKLRIRHKASVPEEGIEKQQA